MRYINSVNILRPVVASTRPRHFNRALADPIRIDSILQRRQNSTPPAFGRFDKGAEISRRVHRRTLGHYRIDNALPHPMQRLQPHRPAPVQVRRYPQNQVPLRIALFHRRMDLANPFGHNTRPVVDLIGMKIIRPVVEL